VPPTFVKRLLRKTGFPPPSTVRVVIAAFMCPSV